MLEQLVGEREVRFPEKHVDHGRAMWRQKRVSGTHFLVLSPDFFKILLRDLHENIVIVAV